MLTVLDPALELVMHCTPVIAFRCSRMALVKDPMRSVGECPSISLVAEVLFVNDKNHPELVM